MESLESVQDYAILLILDGADLDIKRVSSNIQDKLGWSPGDLIGKSASTFLDEASFTRLKNHACSKDRVSSTGCVEPIRVRVVQPSSCEAPSPEFATAQWDAFIQSSDAEKGLFLLELEAVGEDSVCSRVDTSIVCQTLANLHVKRTEKDLCAEVARGVGQITGYDRVLVYRFEADGHGVVLAEWLPDESWDSYMGLHFPSYDIPAAARKMFLTRRLRMIINANTEPSPIVPDARDFQPTGNGAAATLQRVPSLSSTSDVSSTASGSRTSYSSSSVTMSQPTGAKGSTTDFVGPTFGAVSPCHAAYMRNMGTAASVVVAVVNAVKEGGQTGEKLWGLIVAHHRTPRAIPFDKRAACLAISNGFTIALDAARQKEERLGEQRVQHMQARLIKNAVEENFMEALQERDSNVAKLIKCGGVAIISGDDACLVGTTPAEDDVMAMRPFLKKASIDVVWHTESLSNMYPPAKKFSKEGSGVLVATISRSRNSYILWFRPELITTVSWAGARIDTNPPNPSDRDYSQLRPRSSFARWSESVVGKSTPFNSADAAAARAFLRTVTAVEERMHSGMSMSSSLSRSSSMQHLRLMNLLPTPLLSGMLKTTKMRSVLKRNVTVLFATIVSFTQLVPELQPAEFVDQLASIFDSIDKLITKHGLEKIKTIGETYLVAAGLNDETETASSFRVARFALDLLRMHALKPIIGSTKFTLRIGMHAGDVVAGVIKDKQVIYDISGDTVRTASRIEALGMPGTVHVTSAVYEQLGEAYLFAQREILDTPTSVLTTFFLLGPNRRHGANNQTPWILVPMASGRDHLRERRHSTGSSVEA